MDGIHDLGGKPGYGRVDRAGSEQPFAARWQAKVFAMVGVARSLGAYTNTDRFRHAIERVNPEAYLAHGYYGRWLGGIENLLVEAGIVRQADITRRALSLGAAADDLIAAQPADSPDPMGDAATAPGTARALLREPLFSVGDRVITAQQAVPGHTRLPEYARGKCGEIIAQHNGWVYPDTNAHGQGEQPQHLYTVRFSAAALWGTEGFSVCLDLFEPYLSVLGEAAAE